MASFILGFLNTNRSVREGALNPEQMCLEYRFPSQCAVHHFKLFCSPSPLPVERKQLTVVSTI